MDHLRCYECCNRHVCALGMAEKHTVFSGGLKEKKRRKGFAALIGTHVTLEGGEVNVGNEEDRLGLEISHHLKDGHIVTFLEHWCFHVCNFEGRTAGSNLIFMQ